MEFSHLKSDGSAKMVDVGEKPDQSRTARAHGRIVLAKETIERIEARKMAKGNVLAVAKVAGIQAAKRTSELIPLCHNISLSYVEVSFETGPESITAMTEVRSIGKTGAEMEALTAVSTTLLTIYDMCKAVDKDMRIGEIKLIEKRKEDVT